ncbi:MAG: SPOR domain-containing protein [Magnetococcales bacterium]|nr:SPOR domain-containing protein [Magnetococcales bacterium]
MNMIIRSLCMILLAASLSACSLVPVVERLALFESDPPPKVGITDGTLAVLPLRGPEEQGPALREGMWLFFKTYAPVGQEMLWRGQSALQESTVFGVDSAERLRNLGVQWVLTGRYRPPPKGFLTLELIQVGDHSPFWMYGLPWMTDEKESDVARKALQKFSERMGLTGRKIVFPVSGIHGFQLPESTLLAASQTSVPSVQSSPGVPQPLSTPPFIAQWRVEASEPSTTGSKETTSRVPATARWVVDMAPPPESAAPTSVPEVPFPAQWVVERSVVPPSLPSTEITAQTAPVQGPDSQKSDGHNTTPPVPVAEGKGGEPGEHRQESYVLQAGLFHELKGALDMVHEMRKRGYEPEIAEIAGHDGQPAVWRVWIGLYDNYKEAQERAGVFLTRESLPVQVVLQSRPMALFRYAVQVGSFLNPVNAKELASGLRLTGYESTVQESRDAKDRVWHSVWVGRFWDMARARQVAREFRDKEGLAAFVTTIDAWSSRQLLAKEVATLRESSAPGPAETHSDGVMPVETAATTTAAIPPEPVAVSPGGDKQAFKYAVQVGSFAEEVRAQAIVEQLRAKGYAPLLMTQTDGHGRLWHVVWVGQFQGFSKARQLRDSYRSREGGPAFVTPIGVL